VEAADAQQVPKVGVRMRGIGQLVNSAKSVGARKKMVGGLLHEQKFQRLAWGMRDASSCVSEGYMDGARSHSHLGRKPRENEPGGGAGYSQPHPMSQFGLPCVWLRPRAL